MNEQDIRSLSEEESVDRFLHGLTVLCRECGIGITGNPVLFFMEHDDYERVARADDKGAIEFA
jgi:hypothetical protein